uniref:Uncharacterized protein n=1 Tax=Anguilla anguilla TaxID=7936 RepID=A0A0E9PGG3_ANGAN
MCFYIQLHLRERRHSCRALTL